MEKVVDARGLTCPQPVLKTKKLLDYLEPETELVTIVDNEAARDNVLKLAHNLACETRVKEQGGEYFIHIRKQSLAATQLDIHQGQVLMVTTASLGQGPEELGNILMRSFFYSLSENDVLPRFLLFLNSGVQLCCQGSAVLERMLALEQRGVEIMVCGSCLDYYNLKDKLCVGNITNMYTIIEHLLAAEKAITL